MAAASGTSGTSVEWYSGTVVKGTGITLVPFLVGFLSPNPPSTHAVDRARPGTVMVTPARYLSILYSRKTP